eukprot:1227396-Rhodomonas_salina.1
MSVRRIAQRVAAYAMAVPQMACGIRYGGTAQCKHTLWWYGTWLAAYSMSVRHVASSIRHSSTARG